MKLYPENRVYRDELIEGSTISVDGAKYTVSKIRMQSGNITAVLFLDKNGRYEKSLFVYII